MQAYLDKNLYKKRRNFRVKIYFYILFSALFCIGIFYIAVYSPIFRIREYKISGGDRFSQENILKILEPFVLNNRLAEFLGKQNLLVWNKRNLNLPNTPLLTADIRRNWIQQSSSTSGMHRRTTS